MALMAVSNLLRVTSGRSCAGSVQLIGVPLRIDEAHQRLNAWYRGHPLRHRREPLPNVV